MTVIMFVLLGAVMSMGVMYISRKMVRFNKISNNKYFYWIWQVVTVMTALATLICIITLVIALHRTIS